MSTQWQAGSGLPLSYSDIGSSIPLSALTGRGGEHPAGGLYEARKSFGLALPRHQEWVN